MKHKVYRNVTMYHENNQHFEKEGKNKMGIFGIEKI